jgi:hypothetical protein
MIASAAVFAFHSFRKITGIRRRSLRLKTAGLLAALAAPAFVLCQTALTQGGQPDANSSTSAPAVNNPVSQAAAIAVVPIDAANAATVTGALRVAEGKAIIATSGTVASGGKTTEVILPKRGVLRVCASTSVHLAADTSVPAGETPGLMMALDHGAVEASFATGRNSDVVLTPDFRILIGGPGSAEVKVRLGEHGDTCVDNPGANAPYVVVSGVFEGGAYRVQPGQRVMFQHGSLNEVVDQEKEPCGCPPEARPGTNDFPLAQSAGLAPLDKPAPPPNPTKDAQTQEPLNQPLTYSATDNTNNPAPAVVESSPPAPAPVAVSTPPPAPKKKPGFFRSIGSFFRKIFGAE